MSNAVAQNTRKNGLKMLKVSLGIWLSCLILAQLVFVGYLIFGYGLSMLTDGIQKWNHFNNTAYLEHDFLGNLAYAGHVLLAILMILGGSLQVIPNIRNRFTKFHRINGRIVMTLACIISVAGMYLILSRGTVGNTLMHALTMFGGVIILVSSFMAVNAIRKGNIRQHKTWAIRLYLAANGVLFFRLMIFAWFMLFGTLGVNTENFTGITVMGVSVASYVLPLFIAEWVRIAQVKQSSGHLFCCASLLLVVSAVFLIGLFAIAAGNWYPAIRA